MRYFLRGIDTVSEWSGKVLRYFIFAIILILLYEVILRYWFDSPTIWAHETVKHIFGAYSVLLGAYVLLYRRHIRIDVIYNRFSPRVQGAVDSFTYLFIFGFVILMLWFGIPLAIDAYVLNEVPFMPFKIPLWPLKASIPLGALLMLLQGLAHWLRALRLAITGRELA